MRYNVRTRGREVKHQSGQEGKKFILTKNIKANKEFGGRKEENELRG